MPTDGEPGRARFTVDAIQVTSFAWHLMVRGSPELWTVAFEDQDFEQKIRTRIEKDLGIGRDDFDVTIVAAERDAPSKPET